MWKRENEITKKRIETNWRKKRKGKREKKSVPAAAALERKKLWEIESSVIIFKPSDYKKMLALLFCSIGLLGGGREAASKHIGASWQERKERRNDVVVE